MNTIRLNRGEETLLRTICDGQQPYGHETELYYLLEKGYIYWVESKKEYRITSWGEKVLGQREKVAA